MSSAEKTNPVAARPGGVMPDVGDVGGGADQQLRPALDPQRRQPRFVSVGNGVGGRRCRPVVGALQAEHGAQTSLVERLGRPRDRVGEAEEEGEERQHHGDERPPRRRPRGRPELHPAEQHRQQAERHQDGEHQLAHDAEDPPAPARRVQARQRGRSLVDEEVEASRQQGQQATQRATGDERAGSLRAVAGAEIEPAVAQPLDHPWDDVDHRGGDDGGEQERARPAHEPAPGHVVGGPPDEVTDRQDDADHDEADDDPHVERTVLDAVVDGRRQAGHPRRVEAAEQHPRHEGPAEHDGEVDADAEHEAHEHVPPAGEARGEVVRAVAEVVELRRPQRVRTRRGGVLPVDPF